MSYLETSGMVRPLEVGTCDNLHSNPNGNPGSGRHAEVPANTLSEHNPTAQALSRLEEIMAGLGGELVVHAEEDGLVKFSIHFQSSPALVQRIESLLCPALPAADNVATRAAEPEHHDPETASILLTTKKFMRAFCQGDMEMCREVLREVADQQTDQELFVEIGQLAREFHTSLSQLTETLDPAFRVIVEEKLPDSGSRLEHILEITENAANTTLDRVEALQGRNEEDIEQIKQLRQILETLTALGSQAHSRLNDAAAIAEKLASSMAQTRDDLVSILMAQDFQDLTGQIIQRVLTLLRDLETKLVTMVKVFGARGERVEEDREALYGPAHKGKTEALHSQDDVDSLLADFGF
jgi:chemotaxis protein CheZ